jgi:hypothetical protein
VLGLDDVLFSEEGSHHDDFIGILPADFSRFDNRGFDKRGRHGNIDYGSSVTITGVGNGNGNGNEASHSQGLSTSSTDLNATLVPGQPLSPHRISFIGNKAAAIDPERDPLLADSRQTVEFRPYDTRRQLGLPLM